MTGEEQKCFADRPVFYIRSESIIERIDYRVECPERNMLKHSLVQYPFHVGVLMMTERINKDH